MNLFPKPFRSELAYNIFTAKYKHDGCETWEDLCRTLVEDVCRDDMSKDDKTDLVKMMSEMKFIPGGRYLYYAGRVSKYFNNCYLLRAEEDSKEDWAELSWKTERCLMTGGGIGVDYSIYRPEGATIKSSGGKSTGPLAKMHMINEIGRSVMQGGTRRSAIYASLNWQHGDAHKFLKSKNWYNVPVKGTDKSIGELKEADFLYPAPMDMTNISLNYDTEWIKQYYKSGDPGHTFKENVKQAITTGEPGFSFNFFDKEKETLRNACCEVTSEDDSDVCNLGSVNMSRIENIEEFGDVVHLGTRFLLLGTLRAHLPYEKINKTREKNRRLGLGLMGIHEWLLKRGSKYEVTPELHQWLSVYKGVSNYASKHYAANLNVSTPVANRAIAPTGTIGMVAGTTTGIEPIYAVAYRRRYLTEGTKYITEYAVDHIAHQLISNLGIKPDAIESSVDLARDYERRIKFQADVQDYVDMAISSTINLPSVPKHGFSDSYISDFTTTLASYAPRLRGFTCYPDGARGGQPITAVDYNEALAKLGKKFEEGTFTDACDIRGGGFCGT
jgi:ribonucleoside-diphosphate reductase alpha chain